MSGCCVTIRPIRVESYGSNLREAWAPIETYAGEQLGAQYWDDFTTVWDEAFPSTRNITAYPDELKQECYSVPPKDKQSFGFGFAYDNDSNCCNDSPYNQGGIIRLVLEVCEPIKMRFRAQGRVERQDLHFDWLLVNVTRIHLEGSPSANILYEHGTGESIGCCADEEPPLTGCCAAMADKDCCVTHELEPGRYMLFISSQTGDGLYHDGAFWNLSMEIWCDGTPSCGVSEDECDSDEPPFPPPDDLEPDPETDLPPHGLPPPGEGEPPTPGYRLFECECDNCNMIAIGIIIDGLVGTSCTFEDGVCDIGGLYALYSRTQTVDALNGDYVLGKQDGFGFWYKDLGDPNEERDGILVQVRDSMQLANCTLDNFDSFWTQIETYCVKIEGRMVCETCETGDPPLPGSKWSAPDDGNGRAIEFYFVEWRRDWDRDADGGNGAWTDWFSPGPSYPLCANLYFDTYVVPPQCIAPPSCFQPVYKTNTTNTKFECAELFVWDCEINTSVPGATAEFRAIGTTALCTPP